LAQPDHRRDDDTPVDSIEQNPQPFPEEIGFIVENAQNYLDVTLKQEDIKSVYAGLRPLVSLKSGKGSTAQLSRDHYIEISESGLVSIAGGKWTTYRKMGEDVVNRAEISADLESRHCVTKNLPIHTSQPKPQDKTLHPALPYSKNQIEASIESEMPLTLEDVLSRRTRAQVLDLAAAKEIAPFIADLMVEKGVLAESEKAAHLAEFDKKAGIIPII
jgi:glycerol-3-phosphate dehydrogenase